MEINGGKDLGIEGGIKEESNHEPAAFKNSMRMDLDGTLPEELPLNPESSTEKAKNKFNFERRLSTRILLFLSIIAVLSFLLLLQDNRTSFARDQKNNGSTLGGVRGNSSELGMMAQLMVPDGEEDCVKSCRLIRDRLHSNLSSVFRAISATIQTSCLYTREASEIAACEGAMGLAFGLSTALVLSPLKEEPKKDSVLCTEVLRVCPNNERKFRFSCDSCASLLTGIIKTATTVLAKWEPLLQSHFCLAIKEKKECEKKVNTAIVSTTSSINLALAGVSVGCRFLGCQ